MGGLGQVQLTYAPCESLWLPAVQVWTDHPTTACMAAQFAGWQVKLDRYFAMGSGPARALIGAETKLYEQIGYSEQADVAVLCLEGRTPPTPEVAAFVAEEAGVAPRPQAQLIAPTASLAGSVQVAARVVETGLHKLSELGFDIRTVRSATGTGPVAPLARSDMRAIGRTNDALLYGAVAHYTVHTDNEAIAAVIDRVPASSSADYGRPFYDILTAYGGNFYDIDPLLFSPAEVYITNAASGRTFHAGAPNAAILRRSFFNGD
jgi:methenyltetrahydromethanopterin cyclohydrolase